MKLTLEQEMALVGVTHEDKFPEGTEFLHRVDTAKTEVAMFGRRVPRLQGHRTRLINETDHSAKFMLVKEGSEAWNYFYTGANKHEVVTGYELEKPVKP